MDKPEQTGHSCWATCGAAVCPYNIKSQNVFSLHMQSPYAFGYTRLCGEFIESELAEAAVACCLYKSYNLSG